ncbi:hypothetical protein SAMN05421820_111167 [Pedobacter steynii]|uniref:Uncharacterized protein n=1 Tax=Pedobacter steynii TaxID=430522 RepID=A0A1H0GJT0_9SPHI|nr:hypothetical protein [Pedobacter steynii]NQX42444.1 hypothetical protein [Pedobacter steynii]SDO07217.1 hypothetical protein SAMN05421820_111167 [Pedobacter steynii]
MIKTFKIIYLAIIVLLFSACEKDGIPVLSEIKAINKEFSITGFVLGDTVEQYFDGVKMREYYGQVKVAGSQSQLAFVKDEINMELKRKSTGETIYQQKFNINDKTNIVPGFYFDGLKFSNGYSYPEPQGDEYIANFYLEPSGGATPIDINIEVLEYYFDDTKPNPMIVVNTTTIPIVENVQPGKWTPYLKVPVPMVTPQQSGTELYQIVVIKDSKTKEYYVNKKRDDSILNLEIPYDGVSRGKVQSFFFNRKMGSGKVAYPEFYDLVQLFPR